MAQHPKEAKSIVQKRLKVDAGTIDRIWQQNVFSLTLDQSLITAMEDEARWMISNGLTREKQIPDFLNYVYVDGLKTGKAGGSQHHPVSRRGTRVLLDQLRWGKEKHKQDRTYQA